MLIRPEATLRALAAEPMSAVEIYRSHVLPLALIPPLCSVAGVLIFGGFQVASVGVRLSPVGAAVEGLAGYLATLVVVTVLAFVVDAAAARFDGVASRLQALKLVALAGTALWIAGALGLYPALGVPAAVLGAMWSLYAIYLGLPILMRVDRNRAITCFAAILLALMALVVARSFLTAWASELGGPLVAA